MPSSKTSPPTATQIATKISAQIPPSTASPSRKKTASAPKAQAAAVFYEPQSYRPEESVGSLMRQILGTLADNIELHLAHTDLTNAQWMPLYKLFSGQASSVAELARECRLDTGAMTRMLDRLEAKGLCQRVRSEADRRVVHIALTDAGIHAAQDIPRVLCGVQNAHLVGFSAEEFATLQTYLRRILANAQSAALQPLPSAATVASAAVVSEPSLASDSGDSHGV